MDCHVSLDEEKCSRSSEEIQIALLIENGSCCLEHVRLIVVAEDGKRDDSRPVRQRVNSFLRKHISSEAGCRDGDTDHLHMDTAEYDRIFPFESLEVAFTLPLASTETHEIPVPFFAAIGLCVGSGGMMWYEVNYRSADPQEWDLRVAKKKARVGVTI